MPVMFHPHLADPADDTKPREITVPDDPGCVAVHEEAGWKVRPEPTSDSPALAPTVTYTVTEPDPEPTTKSKGRKATTSPEE